MRPEPDITRIVESWLLEGADRLPDRVLDSVLERVPSTPQRRPMWSVRRLPDMPNLLRVAALAAVLLVAVVAARVLLPAGTVGGPAPTSSPSPLVTAAPSPSSAARISSWGMDASPIPAGTYRVQDPFALPFTVTFASPWVPKTLLTGDAQFMKSKTATDAPSAWVVVDLAEQVFADPCHSEGGSKPPAPATVDGYVAALTTMAGFTAGPVTDTSIDGFSGKRFTLTNAIDTATAGCVGGPMLPMWTFRGGDPSGAATNGGNREELWVVDVGGTIVVIDGECDPVDLPEVQSIVEGITFK